MEIREMLARAWIECDPNRGGTDPDKLIDRSGSGYTNEDGTFVNEAVETPLEGKPNWHWFLPRAEALLEYIKSHNYELVRRAVKE